MKIIKSHFVSIGDLKRRKVTETIFLHRTALTPQTLYRCALNAGLANVSYHYYIDLQGNVYTGRNADAESIIANAVIVEIEGTDTPNDVQVKAGRELIAHIKNQYPDINKIDGVAFPCESPKKAKQPKQKHNKTAEIDVTE